MNKEKQMTFTNEDCMEGMKQIKDKSIDMILCDLPYGTTACKWDTVIPFEPLWEQYKRIIKDKGAIVLTASQPFTSALVMSNVKMFKYEWIWEKTQSRGHLLAYKRPMGKHENILVFCKEQSIYNPIITDKPTKDIRPYSKSGKTEIYNNKTVNQNETRKIPLDKKLPESILKIANAQNTVHPTQKPVALFEYLIKTYTNEGDLVLDNCAGSGTTAIACINTKRDYICMEKDKDYFRMANERIAKYREQLRLFI